MKYIAHAILEVCYILLCIITNPIVALFADKYGQLPKIFKLWQTYDNCLDVRWMVYEDGCTPKLFHYDYDKHYVYHYEDKSDGKMIPGYVDILDDHFTTKEIIQRYFCRLTWLYRNCNYGFSYYINGRDYYGGDNVVVVDKDRGTDNETWVSYIKGGNIFTRTWSVCIVRTWCKYFSLRLYIGWKLIGCTKPYHARAMIAAHFNPFRPRW